MFNPFTDNTAIQIRLHRNSNPERDDSLAIRYKEDNYYQIFFQDGDSDTKQTFCTVLSGEQVDTYINSLFTLLAADTDPFRHIQFLLPCFPSVLYDIEDLRKGKIRKALKEVLPILTAAAKY